MRQVVITVTAIIAFIALSFGSLYLGGFFKKHSEKIRYDIQKESQSYRDGMERQMNGLCFEYRNADSTGKRGIAIMARDLFSSEDTTGYPPHLQKCMSEMGIR